MKTTNQPLTDRLATYARLTAADTDTDIAAVARAMAERSDIVADDLGCDAADVEAWALEMGASS